MFASDADFDTRLRDAKLAALAEFAAGAGHEINNPVATIVGRAQLLLKDEIDPNRRRSLATIAAQALRIRDMIGDLMLFARPPQPQPARCDLVEIVREVLAPLAEEFPALTFAATGPVIAFADPLQVAVAIETLVRNAAHAADGHAEVVVSETPDAAVLTVADAGPGFTDTDRQHAFDPFYSGRQAGRGLGFGLPKCWRIVTLAGGTVTVTSQPGQTVFTLTLPRAAAKLRVTGDTADWNPE